MTDQIGIYDHETGETIVREMTAEEQELRNAEIAAYNAEKAAQATASAKAQAARDSAIAKLSALGLDLDDLKALGL
jgi:hypothetical protein